MSKTDSISKVSFTRLRISTHARLVTDTDRQRASTALHARAQLTNKGPFTRRTGLDKLRIRPTISYRRKGIQPLPTGRHNGTGNWPSKFQSAACLIADSRFGENNNYSSKYFETHRMPALVWYVCLNSQLMCQLNQPVFRIKKFDLT